MVQNRQWNVCVARKRMRIKRSMISSEPLPMAILALSILWLFRREPRTNEDCPIADNGKHTGLFWQLPVAPAVSIQAGFFVAGHFITTGKIVFLPNFINGKPGRIGIQRADTPGQIGMWHQNCLFGSFGWTNCKYRHIGVFNNFSATDPNRMRSMPLRPWVPITIISAFFIMRAVEGFPRRHSQ